jgi:hypothetical protein
MQFTNIYKTIIENTITVRKGGRNEPEQIINANFYHEMASKIADLNIDIEQGKFDV